MVKRPDKLDLELASDVSDRSEPLSDRSYAMIRSACRKLNDAAIRCILRNPPDDWMGDPEYIRAEQEWDAVMDMIPEWAPVRAAALAEAKRRKRDAHDDT